jgi:hypothetical protein
MDHRGHPKRPFERASLPLNDLAQSFLSASFEEDPPLAKALSGLDNDGRNQLGGVLGRFDLRGKGELTPEQRLLARRVLTRLHKPSADGLVLTNKILDYLDFNVSAVLEDEEIETCVEILELFARVDSDNDTLSMRELEMLYAVLRYLDQNDNGQLDAVERDQLRRGLGNPAGFMDEQRHSNPLLIQVIGAPR